MMCCVCITRRDGSSRILMVGQSAAERAHEIRHITPRSVRTTVGCIAAFDSEQQWSVLYPCCPMRHQHSLTIGEESAFETRERREQGRGGTLCLLQQFQSPHSSTQFMLFNFIHSFFFLQSRDCSAVSASFFWWFNNV